MNKTLLLAAAIALAFGAGLPSAPAATADGAVPASTADTRFQQIYTTEWAWRTGQAGISASGEAQPNNGRLDTVDAARQQRDKGGDGGHRRVAACGIPRCVIESLFVPRGGAVR